METARNAADCGLESRKERGQWEEQDVDGRLILEDMFTSKAYSEFDCTQNVPCALGGQEEEKEEEEAS
jgi:hypothetical protein